APPAATTRRARRRAPPPPRGARGEARGGCTAARAEASVRARASYGRRAWDPSARPLQRLGERVPDALDRPDVGAPELLADLPHVDVHRPVHHEHVGAPHGVEELLAREDAAGVGGEEV